MGLFGKKKLSEIEAAGQFVLMVTKGVQQHWPEIASELRGMFQAEDSISDDQYASFEFVLAVIATQIQALPNLLAADQASRVREYIMQCISSPELEAYPREAIQEYQNAWDQALQQGEPPFYGIASVLFDKLECRSTVELGEARFKSPLLLMALSEIVVTFGGPWWKTMTQEYKLVP
jgi:hypothetical protein